MEFAFAFGERQHRERRLLSNVGFLVLLAATAAGACHCQTQNHIHYPFEGVTV